jgi:hypothetical protein
MVATEISGMENMIPQQLVELLGEDAIAAILSQIANAARAEWIRLAGKELFTSRRDYINGIQPVAFEPGQATISLVGELPNIVENGMSQTDMHDTLLGPKVPVVAPGERGKHKKKGGGYYRPIPFRHGTPDSGGAVGQPMGRPYGRHSAVEDAKALGKSIYNAAKKLTATTSEPGKGTKWGGRLPTGMAPKLKPHHAVDIYAGMVRERKKYKSATQSQYTTFRMISTGSPGWIRPATTGAQLAPQVDKFVHKLAPQAIEAYIDGIIGG